MRSRSCRKLRRHGTDARTASARTTFGSCIGIGWGAFMLGQANTELSTSAKADSSSPMLSLTPYGAQSDDEDVPEGWPQAPFSFWFRRHDEFNELPPSASP